MTDPFGSPFDPSVMAVRSDEDCAGRGHQIFEGPVNLLENMSFCADCTFAFALFLTRAVELVTVPGEDGLQIAEQSALQVLGKWRAEGGLCSARTLATTPVPVASAPTEHEGGNRDR